jgi:hypothetical protein
MLPTNCNATTNDNDIASTKNNNKNNNNTNNNNNSKQQQQQREQEEQEENPKQFSSSFSAPLCFLEREELGPGRPRGWCTDPERRRRRLFTRRIENASLTSRLPQ